MGASVIIHFNKIFPYKPFWCIHISWKPLYDTWSKSLGLVHLVIDGIILVGSRGLDD